MDKTRQWSLLTVLGVVAVLVAGWFLLVSPQQSHAKDLKAQAASQQSSTNSLEAQVQQLKAQQKNEPAQQRKLMQIATQIPDNPALPALIRDLSSAAHDAGVTLVSLAPSAPSLVTPAVATGSVAPSTTGAAAASAAAASPLGQIPIVVQVDGSYFNIESFFRTVEHLDRAMMVTGFTLSPGTSGGATPSGTTGTSSTDAAAQAPGTLTGNIQAVVFESPTVAPATGASPVLPSTQAPAPATAASTAPSASSAQ